MLIGKAKKKPNLEKVKYIKKELRNALYLQNDAIITITELTCFEEGCNPIETVIGLLRAKEPPLQHKIHKDILSLTSDDLLQVCSAWGFATQDIHFQQFSTTNHNFRS